MPSAPGEPVKCVGLPKPEDEAEVVALNIDIARGANVAHSPVDPGGDSVTWFYSPTGDLAGCPVLDAGSDASRSDDAGAGAPP